MRLKIVENITSELLIESLEKGQLSIWVIMLGMYGHSNLLHGFNRKGRYFYFFDPLYGEKLIKFEQVNDYLNAPIMKVGLFLERNLDSLESLKELINKEKQKLQNCLNIFSNIN